MHKKRVLLAVIAALVVGVAVGSLAPAALLSKERPTDLSQALAAWGRPEQRLDPNATPLDVLGMMITSHERWHTLHALVDVQLNTAAFLGQTEEVWLDSANEARVVTTEAEGGDPTLISVSDGERYTIYDPAGARYYRADVPPSMKEASDPYADEPVELPEGPVTFPHPITMLLPARSLSYLLPTGLGQSLRNFETGLTVLGTERLGARDAAVLDARLSQEGTLIRHLRLWVDREYGVVLKAQHFSGDAETWYLQVVVRQIDFNSAQSSDLFSLELPPDATPVDSPARLAE
jgi:outer membrane lipoprotein-sorting protein